jgi:predicted lipoprotein
MPISAIILLTVKNKYVNRIIKYGLLVLAFALVAYQSVYFEKLSVHNSKTGVKFDPAAFGKKLWEEQLPAKMDSAVSLTFLIDATGKNKEAAFEQYTNSLAIGNYRYALVKAEALVEEVKEDEVLATVSQGDTVLHIKLATEFIYGNAVRDASGLVEVKDFPNTTDLNGISEELNRIVRTKIIPAVKRKLKKGDRLNIVAAIELNKEHIHWHGIELYPVRIEIMP